MINDVDVLVSTRDLAYLGELCATIFVAYKMGPTSHKLEHLMDLLTSSINFIAEVTTEEEILAAQQQVEDDSL